MSAGPGARTTVVVVAPDLEAGRRLAKGGIGRVNLVYERAGLFGTHADGLVVRLHASTIDGPQGAKATVFLRGLLTWVFTPLPRPAVVHLHTSWHASFWRKMAFAWLAWLKGARVLLHVHPTYFVDFVEGGGALRRGLVRATLRRCEGVIALCEEVAERLRPYAPRARVYVLPNPVDLDEFPPPPDRPRDAEHVLYLGWFVPGKGAFDLLEALARLRGRRPGLRATFGGARDPEQDAALRRRVRELALDDVVGVEGWIGREEVIRRLGACTLLALPTYSEGIPMVLLEAMACGAPVVTCPVGGIPEVARDGRNALFVRPGDLDGLAAALERLLDDGALREAMSRANLEDIRRYDVRTLLPRLLEIYREMAGPAA